MKKILAMLLQLVPMVLLGDVPSPVRRVQRIGYEVLDDSAGGVGKPVLGVAAVVLVLVGMFALGIVKKDAVLRIMRSVKKSRENGWTALFEDCAVLGVAMGVVALLGTCGCWGEGAHGLELAALWVCLFVLFLLWTFVRPLVCLIILRRIYWWPWLMGVVTALVAIVGLGFYVREKTLAELTSAVGPHGYNRDRVNNPGWKYPDEISDEECSRIDAQMEAVKADLQKAFDSAYGAMVKNGEIESLFEYSTLPRTGPVYMRMRGARRLLQENAESVILKVLRSDLKLRDRCRGIPLEWLARMVSRNKLDQLEKIWREQINEREGRPPWKEEPSFSITE